MEKLYSKYSPDKEVTVIQLIIEIVCENYARKNNKDLPTFFWKLPEWEKYYKSQIRKCNNLCKDYGEKKVLEFVKTKKIYNLNGKNIKEWLQEFKYSDRSLNNIDTKQTPKIEINKEQETKISINKIKGFDKLD